MKTKKKMEEYDKHAIQLFQFITELFEDEFVVHREDMDYKTKKWFQGELEQTYNSILALLVNNILDEDTIKKLVNKLTLDVLFLQSLLEDYIDLCNELPLHYITVVGYILVRVERVEKYEMCENIRKFYLMYGQKLIDEKILIV